MEGTLLTSSRKCGCAHFSALIVLLSNIIISPNHQSRADLQIATQAIKLFDKLLEVLKSPLYQPLQHIVEDLYQSATKVVEQAWLEQPDEPDDVITASDEIIDLNFFSKEPSFSTFEYDPEQLEGLEFNGIFDSFAGEKMVDR